MPNDDAHTGEQIQESKQTKGAEEQTVAFRIKDINRALYEHRPLPLPGLDTRAAQRQAEDDVLIDLYGTQELSLAAIQAELERRNEEGKERLTLDGIAAAEDDSPIAPEDIVARPTESKSVSPPPPKPKPKHKGRSPKQSPKQTPKQAPKQTNAEIARETSPEDTLPLTAPQFAPLPELGQVELLPELQPLPPHPKKEEQKEKQEKKRKENPPKKELPEDPQHDFWYDDEPLYHVPVLPILILCYRLLYFFGLRTMRPILRFGRLAVLRMMHPLRVLLHMFRAFIVAVKHFTWDRARTALREANETHKQSLAQQGKLPFPDAIRLLARDYQRIVHTLCNTAAPILALAVLLIVINIVSQQTYALELDYNNAPLGYIAEENVYLSAQQEALAHLTAADNENVVAGLGEASYKLALVSPEQLTDKNTLSDALLENAPRSMVSACGVFVDEKLVATIRNETDASSVLDSIKTKYASQVADLGDGDVQFVEKIDLVQSFYPEDSPLMMDAQGLSTLLNSEKDGEKVEFAREDDSIYTIAKRNNTSEAHLLALNPKYRDSYLHEGDRVILKNKVSFLQVKIVKTQTRKASVQFEIIETPNYDMYQGERRTRKAGVPGEDTVTERVTLVNGSIVSTEEIGRVRTKEPVAERRDIGKKSTKVTVNGKTYNINPSAQGFVWPTPTLKQVTSPYGYRRSGFHTGVDISGSGASGKLVVAAKDGRVEMINRSGSGYGNQIVINHGNGVKTRYAHLYSGSISVSVGDSVIAGQPIARVGSTGNSTGPHLHFEVIINGSTQNPMNYLKK